MSEEPNPKEIKRELAKRELARRSLRHFISYNFEDFQFSWHHDVLIDKLEAVERGDIKKLMIFMPPRHSKSETVSIQFPAWVVGRDKDKNIIEASYASSLATDFGRQVRNLIKAPEYSNVFDTQLSEDSEAKDKWNTDGRGAYNAVGVGGAVTGKGADIFIIDDPVKNRQDAESQVIQEGVYDWYKSTALTRLSPEGAMIVVMTRWHLNDLAGKILADAEEGEWDVVSLPAIAIEDEEHRKEGEALWPTYFSLDNLNTKKRNIGIYEWNALYQQNPVTSESQEFKPEFIQSITEEEVAAKHTRRFLTIDTAISQKTSADYTGIVDNRVDINNKWYIKSEKRKFGPKELIDLLFTYHANNNYDAIGIEKTIYLQAIKPFLDEEQRERNTFLPIVELSHSQTAKEVRIRGLLPRYQTKSVFHIKGQNSDLEGEMFTFPKGIHDDVLDSLAYQPQIAKKPRGMTMGISQTHTKGRASPR